MCWVTHFFCSGLLEDYPPQSSASFPFHPVEVALKMSLSRQQEPTGWSPDDTVYLLKWLGLNPDVATRFDGASVPKLELFAAEVGRPHRGEVMTAANWCRRNFQQDARGTTDSARQANFVPWKYQSYGLAIPAWRDGPGARPPPASLAGAMPSSKPPIPPPLNPSPSLAGAGSPPPGAVPVAAGNLSPPPAALQSPPPVYSPVPLPSIHGTPSPHASMVSSGQPSPVPFAAPLTSPLARAVAASAVTTAAAVSASRLSATVRKDSPRSDDAVGELPPTVPGNPPRAVVTAAQASALLGTKPAPTTAQPSAPHPGGGGPGGAAKGGRVDKGGALSANPVNTNIRQRTAGAVLRDFLSKEQDNASAVNSEATRPSSSLKVRIALACHKWDTSDRTAIICAKCLWPADQKPWPPCNNGAPDGAIESAVAASAVPSSNASIHSSSSAAVAATVPSSASSNQDGGGKLASMFGGLGPPPKKAAKLPRGRPVVITKITGCSCGPTCQHRRCQCTLPEHLAVREAFTKAAGSVLGPGPSLLGKRPGAACAATTAAAPHDGDDAGPDEASTSSSDGEATPDATKAPADVRHSDVEMEQHAGTTAEVDPDEMEQATQVVEVDEGHTCYHGYRAKQPCKCGMAAPVVPYDRGPSFSASVFVSDVSVFLRACKMREFACVTGVVVVRVLCVRLSGSFCISVSLCFSVPVKNANVRVFLRRCACCFVFCVARAPSACFTSHSSGYVNG